MYTQIKKSRKKNPTNFFFEKVSQKQNNFLKINLFFIKSKKCIFIAFSKCVSSYLPGGTQSSWYSTTHAKTVMEVHSHVSKCCTDDFVIPQICISKTEVKRKLFLEELFTQTW